ncbi:hypothetical protein [Clostridium sp. MCC353]
MQMTELNFQTYSSAQNRKAEQREQGRECRTKRA